MKKKIFKICIGSLAIAVSAIALTFTAPSPFVNHFGAEIIGTSTSFRVWGPECSNIFLTGTFNNWNKTNLPLVPDTSFGSGYGGPYWSIAIDGILTGEFYKYIIINDEGKDCKAKKMFLAKIKTK